MNELYSRIESLCEDAGISITEMCKKSGAPRGSLTDLKNGRVKGLSATTLAKISAFFNIPIDCLVGNEDPDAMVRAGADIIPLYYELSPEDRAAVDALIARLATSSPPEH